MRQAEGLPRPPEEPAAPARLVPEDLTLVPPEGQARALGQALERRLIELKVSEVEAKANAAIWEAFFETTSRKYGVRIDRLLADYGIDVRRMSRADIEQLQPGVLEQAARSEIERVSQRLSPKARPGDEFVTVGQANRLATAGDPDAGVAAMIAYVTDDFHAMSSDRKLGRPATKALMEWVQKTPPDQTGPLYRVLAFKTEGARMEFVEKMKTGKLKGLEAERPVMSFTTESPARGTMSTHIGRDVASQFGDYPLVLEVKGRAGGALHIGRDVSKAYGPRSEFGTDVLVPKGTQFELGAVRTTAGEPWITLHPTKGAEAPVLFQRQPGETLFQSEARSQIIQTAKKMQERWYSDLSRQLEAANIKASAAKGWKDYLKGLMGKGAVKAEELKWSGLEEWLDLQGGRVSKDQVMEFLKGNGVKIDEVVRGDPERPSPAVREWKALDDELGDMGYELIMEPDPHTGESVLVSLEHMATRAIYPFEPDRGFVPYENAPALPARVDEIGARLANIESEMPSREMGGDGDTKFHAYQLAGARANYRELVLTAPFRQQPAPFKPPEPLAELPPGYEPIHDANAPEGGRWGVTPPGQTHARPWAGSHPTREAAIEAALKQYNELVRVTHEGQWRAENERRGFRDAHFPEENPVAHVRFNERTDADGARVLFIEEIQSDWAQKGRREGFNVERKAGWIATRNGVPRRYDTREEAERAAGPNGTITQWFSDDKGVPSAPFVGKTDAWVGLTLKRMIREAAERGFDKVAWTTGEQQVARYTQALRKEVDADQVEKDRGGCAAGRLQGTPAGRRHHEGRDRTLRCDREVDGRPDQAGPQPGRRDRGREHQDRRHRHGDLL